MLAGTPLDVLRPLGAWASREIVDNVRLLAPSHVARYADNARLQELDTIKKTENGSRVLVRSAGVAQLVEQRIRNAKVEGSTPSTGTIKTKT
jgi:hypothetical protein